MSTSLTENQASLVQYLISQAVIKSIPPPFEYIIGFKNRSI